MRCAMCKPQILSFKRFAARLTEINNYLQLFPGPIEAKKMASEYLNKILLHAIPNFWLKQSDIQGWDFKGNTYNDTCEIFEWMEIAEQVYEGGTPSKNTTWADSNRASHGIKLNEREAASPTNPEKGRVGKRKKFMQAIQVIVQLVKNMLVTWPQALLRGV